MLELGAGVVDEDVQFAVEVGRDCVVGGLDGGVVYDVDLDGCYGVCGRRELGLDGFDGLVRVGERSGAQENVVGLFRGAVEGSHHLEADACVGTGDEDAFGHCQVDLDIVFGLFCIG